MQLNPKIHSAFAILLVGVLAFSCKKTSSPATVPSGPVKISSVSPLEGPAGTAVRIIGSGFSATPGANDVTFNGKPATVTYSDDSILLVTVPLTAGSGNVSVTVKGTTAAGPSFTYDYQGVVSTYAGSATALPGAVNGTAATFNSPRNIAVDGSGNLYVTDFNNKMIRKITTDGTVSTLINLKDNPYGVALDGNGHLDVSLYTSTPSILQISLSTSDTTTLSGSGAWGDTDSPVGADALFYQPAGLAVDQKGNLYVADAGLDDIRMVTPTGATTTIAGISGVFAFQNGPAGKAQFNIPTALVLDAAGNCYVADKGNLAIRKIATDDTVSTLAGNGFAGNLDGVDTAAGFNDPSSITMDSKGNLYVTDAVGNAIRMITPAGVVTTIAGGTGGSKDGIGSAASFNGPSGIACDANGTLWVVDNGNNTIRKITLQ